MRPLPHRQRTLAGLGLVLLTSMAGGPAHSVDTDPAAVASSRRVISVVHEISEVTGSSEIRRRESGDRAGVALSAGILFGKDSTRLSASAERRIDAVTRVLCSSPPGIRRSTARRGQRPRDREEAEPAGDAHLPPRVNRMPHQPTDLSASPPPPAWGSIQPAWSPSSLYGPGGPAPDVSGTGQDRKSVV